MNKHGFKGVYKHTSPRHSRKPYYARVRKGIELFVSKHFATAEEAGLEFKRIKAVSARHHE